MARKLRPKSKNSALVEERRRAIIEAAVTVFKHKSYEKARVEEVAQAANMTAGNIYRYVGTKSDILRLICLHEKGSIQHLLARLAGLDEGSTTETLKRAIDIYVRISVGNGDRIIFYNGEIRNFSHEDRTIPLRSQADHFEFFRNLILKGISNGEFETEKPLFLAQSILLIPHNWLMWKWLLKDRFTLDDYVNDNIEVIITSLTKTAALRIYTSAAVTGVKINSRSHTDHSISGYSHNSD